MASIAVEPARIKPRLRGISHQFACGVALVAGAVMVTLAPTRQAATAAGVYAAALVALFGASALYHVPTWKPAPRRWLRRLDHASIFLLIAGTYTPVCMLALGPPATSKLLAMVWIGAGLGILQCLFWVDAPKPLATALYMALGWIMLPYVHDIWTSAPSSLVLVLAGGLFYSAGAVIYALRRPDPLPKVFGYHEVFHALVIMASICHFTAVALLVGRATV